jgi:ubiquinone/menaquinone biosynthesis C-methylase UbiE
LRQEFFTFNFQLLTLDGGEPMTSNFSDAFGNAQAYEIYVGRWSRLVAGRFIPWLAVAPGLTWLDVGAGTGVLTQVILETAAPSKVLGVDFSPDYIEYARQHRAADRVEYRVGDALDMGLDAVPFDVAVSGLVLNFVASPQTAAQGMADAVRSGGTVGAYVWDYSGHMEMMRHFWDAANQVDPAASEQDAGQRFTICNPDNLAALFQSVGLTAVEATAIDVPTRFQDFDDYWQPFQAAQGSAAKYLRSISDDTRNAIAAQLQRQLPIAADGSISLIARAWAVKGQKP